MNATDLPARTKMIHRAMHFFSVNNMETKHDLNHNRCFRSESPFLSRKQESAAIRQKYPQKIPIILEKNSKDKAVPMLDKNKFLVPEDITMSQFLVIVRRRMQIHPKQALYLLVADHNLISMTLTIGEAYKNYADEDGFLYIMYSSQEVFGYHNDNDDLRSFGEVEVLRLRFPNKVPMLVNRYSKDKTTPILKRNRYLAPQEMTMSQFIFIMRTNIQLEKSQSLYLLVHGKTLNSTMTLGQAYEQFRSSDGCLHIDYATQEFFG